MSNKKLGETYSIQEFLAGIVELWQSEINSGTVTDKEGARGEFAKALLRHIESGLIVTTTAEMLADFGKQINGVAGFPLEEDWIEEFAKEYLDKQKDPDAQV